MERLIGTPSRLILALSVSLASGNACAEVAGFNTGNDLHPYCTGESGRVGEAWCLGYVEGVFDLIAPYLCPGGRVSNHQVRDVVKKHLSDHPADRHRPAAELVVKALREAFPCPTKSPGQ